MHPFGLSALQRLVDNREPLLAADEVDVAHTEQGPQLVVRHLQRPRRRRAAGRRLRERGLLFVGIDVIEGHLTEINVTSPTGIRAVKNFGGPDIAALIWDKIEAMRA